MTSEQENAVKNLIPDETPNRETEIISENSPTSDAPTPKGPLSGKTCSIASLGCPKNLVDGETMIGRLVDLGCELAPDAEKVDVFVLNTCGFLRSARDEAAECVRDALAEKAAGDVRFLLVTGCAVATDGEELARLFPGVDAWLSPFDEAKIADVVLELFAEEAEKTAENAPEAETPTELKILTPDEYLAAQEAEKIALPPRFYCNPARNLTLDDSLRVPLTAPSVAYLKIADGCDRFCSYCAIPNIRGRFVSKPLDQIVAEAERLAARGVRELVLIAQETTFWGSDLFGEPRLAALLATLKEKNWFDWIRVLYSYPLYWSRELTSLFRLEEPGTTSILPYVDVPLQHCNSEILKKMNRRVDKTQTEELLARLREEIPGVVLRSTFIVGFPGETDAAFQELADFLEKWKFERAGIFEYSAEPGTPAAELDGQVDATVKARRLERLYAKQERISRRFARSFIGKTIDVTLDARAVSEGGATMRNVCLGRTFADAPDVDPIVYVTGRDLELGKLTRCEIVDAQGLDLIAVPADPEKIFVSKEERKAAFEREEREANPAPKPPKKSNKKRDFGPNGGGKRGGGNGRNRRQNKRK